MNDSTNPGRVVQLKEAFERLSRGICDSNSDENDFNSQIKDSIILDTLKGASDLLRTGCGGDSPSKVLGWSNDFYQCMSLLCFERYEYYNCVTGGNMSTSYPCMLTYTCICFQELCNSTQCTAWICQDDSPRRVYSTCTKTL